MAASPIPNDIHVARGGIDDLADVMAVMDEAFEARYGEGWTLSQCAGIMPLKGVDLMIARHGDGSICGFSLARTIVDESELLLLAVPPSQQCQGIGQLLLDLFVESGHREKCVLLHLEVREGNRAIDMYRRAGFEPIGIRNNYYRGIQGERFNAVTMAVRLQA